MFNNGFSQNNIKGGRGGEVGDLLHSELFQFQLRYNCNNTIDTHVFFLAFLRFSVNSSVIVNFNLKITL